MESNEVFALHTRFETGKLLRNAFEKGGNFLQSFCITKNLFKMLPNIQKALDGWLCAC